MKIFSIEHPDTPKQEAVVFDDAVIAENFEAQKMISEYVDRSQQQVERMLSERTKLLNFGMANDFFVFEPEEVINIPKSWAVYMGVRRPRLVERVLRDRNNTKIRRMITTPTNPNPEKDFQHGAEMQDLAYKKGVRVPRPIMLVKKYGYSNLETGNLIEGTEDIVSDMFYIMEQINGVTLEQICDPEKKLRLQLMPDFTANTSYIYRAIEGALKKYPFLKDIDFVAGMKDLREQVERMHVAQDGLPAILHNDLHIGNVIFTPDNKSFIIDFDRAKKVDLLDGEKAGVHLDEYRYHTGKGASSYMPDAPVEDSDDRRYYHAFEHFASYTGLIGRHRRENW